MICNRLKGSTDTNNFCGSPSSFLHEKGRIKISSKKAQILFEDWVFWKYDIQTLLLMKTKNL